MRPPLAAAPARPARRCALTLRALADAARRWSLLWPWLALLAGGAQASPQPAQAPSLSFAELEAAGATIGQIHIVAHDIFDTSDPREDKLLFRWANALHAQTRPGVILHALLFRSGDRVSARLLEETERVLRSNRYFYDVQIRPLAVHDGVVDIEVMTRDTWTLEVGASAGRSGGSNSSGLSLRDYNLLGSGWAVGVGRSKNVDRSGSEFQLSNDHAFGSWTKLDFSHASNTDGRSDALSVAQPFYALESRWAAGASVSRNDRVDSLYNAGEVASQYRHRENRGEVYGGWSPGLVDGWTQRISLGASYQDDAYAPEPGRAAPDRLPTDERLVAPFLRYERIEDRYQRKLNRNLIGRPEFFALGLAAQLQLGWASTALGSSHPAWLYAGSLSRGYEPWPEHTLIATLTLAGQFRDGQVRRQRLGASAQYYLPQGPHRLLYVSASAEVLTRPEAIDALLLGGDNGLRGYPLRYQSGSRRALFTVEQRGYTDLYLWQLFRIGGAAYVDLGRAWAGDNSNTRNPGWLGNAGIGLRIVSARSAFSNVLHVDLAFPLATQADVKKLQFLVKTKASF